MEISDELQMEIFLIDTDNLIKTDKIFLENPSTWSMIECIKWADVITNSITNISTPHNYKVNIYGLIGVFPITVNNIKIEFNVDVFMRDCHKVPEHWKKDVRFQKMFLEKY